MTPARMQRLRDAGAVALGVFVGALTVEAGVAVAALIGWSIGL
jgi:hypothetical protein